ncbi:MAG: 50S ribosomal protein L3 [Candidatus Anstonellales archaeon]
MTDIRKPRAGSLAYRPRKRAEKELPSINYWPEVSDKAILGFAGYKVGMTTIGFIDNTNSPTKGQEVITGATVLEAPPMKVYGIRAYNNGNSVVDEYVEDKEVLKMLNAKKIAKKEIKEWKNIVLLAFAQPSFTKIGKKHIERMEIGIGGGDQKLEYARSLLGKELHIFDVFKPGQFVDVIAVTKGKGWQGPVKRFGVSMQRPKATGRRRHVGNIGPFHPGYTMYTARMAGQLGYHKRTELNKWIVKIGKKEEAEAINPDGGFPHYGFVLNDYIILKGSVPGAIKRPVRLRLSLRKPGQVLEPKITYISKGIR